MKTQEDYNKAKGAIVKVFVQDHKKENLYEARVFLHSVKTDEIFDLIFDQRVNAYQASDIPYGKYLIKVECKGFLPDQRSILINKSESEEFFILGETGMLVYYSGKIKIPFKPIDDLLGISVRANISKKGEEELGNYLRGLGVQFEEVSPAIRNDNVRAVRILRDIDKLEKQNIQLELEKHILVRLVGPIIYIDEKSLTFLTNELIVGFKSHVTREEVHSLAKKQELNLIRDIRYAKNAYLLRSGFPASYDLLQIAEELIKNEIVEYAEPNLVTTVVDFQINPTDFLFPEQWHSSLIGLPATWQFLRNSNAAGILPGSPGDLTFGNEDIIIGVLDRGIESQTIIGVTSALSPEFNGTVTSGINKVYQFFDFARMTANNDNPPNNHGMGCAGVASAQCFNPSVIPAVNEGIVGAAPNCRVMGLIRPSGGTRIQYSDAFIWIAGFDPGWIIDNVNYFLGDFLPPQISPGADVITNSFGWSAWPIQRIMMETIDFLTTYGRNGKGVLLFFAAGNGDTWYNNQVGLAAHQKAMAVAASSLANDGVTEVRADYSNFGNGIDFCAPSHDQYMGNGAFHNPPDNYGIPSCDLAGQGNLPGHPQIQTTLSQIAGPCAFTTLTAQVNWGGTTLNVTDNTGFTINQWIRLGHHGDAGAEWVRITAIPAGNTQLTVTPVTGQHFVRTTVIATTTLNVANNNGFNVNDWVLLGNPGDVGFETVLIRIIPAGNTQIVVAGPLNNHAVNTSVIGGPNNYRNDFGGTSSVAPLIAGIAALILSINPDLTWVQVRQILRDTALRIDLANVNPIGQWVDNDGDGVAEYSQWYGYGRVDPLAAVQTALGLVGINPINHIDTWIRENNSDIGDVPSLPPYSPDIWVRNTDPILDNPAQVTQHQSPIRDQDNWVYVNVRNRGAVDSHNVYVRIFITRWAGTQYIYPDDFIPTNPPGLDPVQPLAPGTYFIGEISIDSIPAGGVVTVNTIWEDNLLPPASVTIDGVTYSWADSCLLVDISPHDGPSPTGNNTWDNNNLAQKNVSIIDPPGDDLAFAFVVGHFTNIKELINLRIERRNLPAPARLYVDYLDPKKTKMVEKLLVYPEKEFPDTKLARALEILCDKKPVSPKNYLIKSIIWGKGARKVFALPTVQNVYVPVPRRKKEYVIVAILATGLKRLKKGEYQINIFQETLTGRIEGGINLIIQNRR